MTLQMQPRPGKMGAGVLPESLSAPASIAIYYCCFCSWRTIRQWRQPKGHWLRPRDLPLTQRVALGMLLTHSGRALPGIQEGAQTYGLPICTPPPSLRLPTPPPTPWQKRWQNVKFGIDAQDDYEDENLYEVSEVCR